MMRRRRAPWGFLVAVVLIAIGAAQLESVAFHTDDGCQIEVHCLACRWHQGAVVVLAAPATAAAAHAPAETLAALPADQPADVRRTTTGSRAPPLA